MLIAYLWWLDQQIAFVEQALEIWDKNLNKDKEWSDTRVQIHSFLTHLRTMKDILKC